MTLLRAPINTSAISLNFILILALSPSQRRARSRSRVFDEENLEEIIGEALEEEAFEGIPIQIGVPIEGKKTARKRTGKKRKPRAPTAKSKLLNSLRSRKKTITSELRKINRDLKSLTCRRKRN